MPNKDDFTTIFARLREILEPYAAKMVVAHDTNNNYYLNMRCLMKNKQPLFFGAVRLGKAYVSFHLMPVYAFPQLRDEMSPELKKHMQGKSCFNFKSVDEKLFKELARLTKKGHARFTPEKLGIKGWKALP